MTNELYTSSKMSDNHERIRVVIVDDSLVQREALRMLLGSDHDIEVVGWASNGQEALRVVAQLRPDVITMDLHMPVMDGIAATQQIMYETPTPIVMVTGGVSPEHQRTAREALQAGVLAVLSKPSFGPSGKQGADELIRTVKSMAGVQVIRRWAPERLRTMSYEVDNQVLMPLRYPPRVVAIGASTGGPQALHAILPQIPATFPLPILVVQHIAPGFASSVVDWLRPLCAIPMELAEHSVALDRPGIWLATTGQHMIVQHRRLVFTDENPVQGHRPSVTMLFRSVAVDYGAAAIGVLLTGMGDDGATGLRDMKRAGAVTIAQDEASSTVFGMPAAAIALGIVDHVLPPARIAPLLVSLVQARPEG